MARLFRAWVAMSPAVVLLGCQPGPAPNPSEVAPQTAKVDSHRDFLWERRKECALQSARVLSQPEWAKPDATISVLGSENHYNEPRDRCYVRIAMHNKEGGKAGIPFFTYTIIDAFDNSLSLSCTEEAVKEMFCSYDQPGLETVWGCGQCRALAKELMSK